MKSIFNHKYQHNDVDAKLVLALERISHIFRVLLWEQTKQYNLSPIQTQILIHVYHQPEAERNITALAQRLNITKATVSDAVKSLVQKKLLKKLSDKEDARFFYLVLTPKGNELVKKIENWGEQFKRNFKDIPIGKKSALYETLLQILINFEEEGIINRNRICFTCRHFQKQKKNRKEIYFCQLLNLPLKTNELRVDCPEHELATG
ncbi:Transcriptional regulator [Ignavibacterium album JCM 16511]|uniref:Transcriptional regulator n=1 Tax=Ignavibacterium album (strain DSM 19864 / JCM 16511 / NBRC 101810 / Mat9-16) TaxID=945713 RepID=I0API6_IGNAJ|nr:MarR family winged helix-turn-helix transcriptional regulator [Ignavibacterium album]AFH50893.1 Transcriptional regulator [Ignavibacterium album JCM 16511]